MIDALTIGLHVSEVALGYGKRYARLQQKLGSERFHNANYASYLELHHIRSPTSRLDG
jgi:hypothetical protein